MQKKLYLLSALLLFACFQISFAQKIKVLQGSVEAIKNENNINVSYDYSEMSVGKFKTETEYIEKKREEYNKKEEGRGDSWEQNWKSDREHKYEPQFEELFNKYSNIKVGDYPSSKYTMIVKTTQTEPGFNVHVARKNAEIAGEIKVVETANPDKIVLLLSFEKAVGRSFGGYDYDTGFRIQEAYADLGKALGKYLSK